MPCSELAHLELLAEIDTLVERLNHWDRSAPTAWQPAEKCQALVRRLTQRAESLRVRLEAPLVVATLGGTGTGKSALINALVGAEVVQTGRQRPTTTRPTLITRRGLTPEMLGIDPATVEWLERDLPALRELVLIDCPDPDTTEEEGEMVHSPGADRRLVGRGTEGEGHVDAASNLARLRAILPKCDVLLVTATQQKYRSARVEDELAAAASGARLVFVQTHADVDDDIRDDWRRVLEASVQHSAFSAQQSAPNALTLALSQRERGPSSTLSQRERRPEQHIFRIDSLRALAEAQNGLQPRGEFAELLDLLTRQMAGAAGNRIRRANFLELTAGTLDACHVRIDDALPSVRQLQSAIDQERGLLAGQVAGQMHSELLTHRRQWEQRLLMQAASRWGLSPFALVLRVYLGIGGLFSGALLYRARTPAQVALWGALEGVRTWRKRRRTRQIDQTIDRAATGGFEPAQLRKAAVVIEGYAAEAGLGTDGRGRHAFHSKAGQNAGLGCYEEIAAEAGAAAVAFAAGVSAELEAVVARLAQRHTGWFTRLRYEILLLAMLGFVLYRLGKNFFYDSWWAQPPAPVYGLEFYLSAGFWLVLWCLLLLWFFCRRLRRGLRGEIAQLASGWQTASAAAGIFRRVEAECHRVEDFRQELQAVRTQVDQLRRQVALGGSFCRVPETHHSS